MGMNRLFGMIAAVVLAAAAAQAAPLLEDFEGYSAGATLEDQSYFSYNNDPTNTAMATVIDDWRYDPNVNKLMAHDCTDDFYRSTKTSLYHLGAMYEDVDYGLDFYLKSGGPTSGVHSVLYLWEMDGSSNRPMQMVFMADGNVQANSGNGWIVTGAGVVARDVWYHINIIVRCTHDARTAFSYEISEIDTGDVVVEVAIADSYGSPWGVKSAQIRTEKGFVTYFDNWTIKPAERPTGPFRDDFESYAIATPLEDQSIYFTNMDTTSLVNKAQVVDMGGNQVMLQDATIGAARTTKLAANYLQGLYGEVEFSVDLRLDSGQTTIYLWEVDGGANNNRPMQIVVNSAADGGVWAYGDTVGGQPSGGIYWIGSPGIIDVGSGKWYRFKGSLHLSPEGALSTADIEITDIAASTVVGSINGIDAKGWPMEVRSLQFRTEVGGVAYYDNLVLRQLPASCEEAVHAQLNSPADFTNDCRVDLNDLAAFAGEWMDCVDPEDPACAP